MLALSSAWYLRQRPHDLGLSRMDVPWTAGTMLGEALASHGGGGGGYGGGGGGGAAWGGGRPKNEGGGWGGDGI